MDFENLNPMSTIGITECNKLIYASEFMKIPKGPKVITYTFTLSQGFGFWHYGLWIMNHVSGKRERGLGFRERELGSGIRDFEVGLSFGVWVRFS